MAHHELIFPLGGCSAEAAEAACLASGAVAVTFDDQHDDPVLEPLPGEMRLWPSTRVRALLADGQDPGMAREQLARNLGIDTADIESRIVPEQVWERAWLKHFKPMSFGSRLWVAPHHAQLPHDQSGVVRLDPGLAFGTGTHASTAMCLEWLDRHFVAGQSVIDYGCGSGILAIAALKLGAARAACFDIDSQALTATRDNAHANAVEARLDVCVSADELPRRTDILIANILSDTLCALAGDFAQRVRPGGSLVLAGILAHQEREVTAAYAPCFDIAAFAQRDSWVGLSGFRR